MTVEPDRTDVTHDPPSSAVERAIRKLVAYASQGNRLTANVAARERRRRVGKSAGASRTARRPKGVGETAFSIPPENDEPAVDGPSGTDRSHSEDTPLASGRAAGNMDQSPSASLAYLHQRLDEVSQSLAAASPTTGYVNEMMVSSALASGQESGATPPLPPGEGGGEGNPPETPRSFWQPSVSGNPGDSGIADNSPSPQPSPEGRGRDGVPAPGDGVPARFESLEGLYQRIAASAAGGGSDQQANNANVETARNTSSILQALEAQNRLLEKGKGSQSQQILWQ